MTPISLYCNSFLQLNFQLQKRKRRKRRHRSPCVCVCICHVVVCMGEGFVASVWTHSLRWKGLQSIYISVVQDQGSIHSTLTSLDWFGVYEFIFGVGSSKDSYLQAIVWLIAFSSLQWSSLHRHHESLVGICGVIYCEGENAMSSTIACKWLSLDDPTPQIKS